MNQNVVIRNETPEDVSAITELTVAAFENLAISQHTEQFIVEALRSARVLTLSLVAELDGRVIGHIAYSIPSTNRRHEPNTSSSALCSDKACWTAKKGPAGHSPYINHPIEVALHLSAVGQVEDEDILIAALFHDTIEDTDTSREEITGEFGERVAFLVTECTDDKSLPKSERKRLQIENAPKKSPEAKMIKIADKTCNLRSILSDPPNDWPLNRQIEYFEWAEKVVAGLLGGNQALDGMVQLVLRDGLVKLKNVE